MPGMTSIARWTSTSTGSQLVKRRKASWLAASRAVYSAMLVLPDSEKAEVLVDLPLADDGAVFIPFGLLRSGVLGAVLLAHHRGDERVVLERDQRLVQGLRQPDRPGCSELLRC